MKTNDRWMRVGAQAAIPVREGRSIDLGGHEIAIFNLGDRAVAVENRCPHRGGPLSDGIVAGNSVVCPLHSWKICFATGGVLRPAETACVSTYPARIEGGYIYVALPAEDEAELAQEAIAQARKAAGAEMQLEL